MFRTAAKGVGWQTLKNQLSSGNRKKTARRVVEMKSAKQISRSRGDILTNSLNFHVKQFSVPTFCCSFRKSWRESPSSWQCLVVPRTRNLSLYLTQWKLHRVWISNELELLRWFERLTWLWNWNSSMVVVTKLTTQKEEKKRSTKKRQKWMRKRWRRRRSKRLQFL